MPERGVPMSFNREARRIVNVLCNTDQAPEDLLDVINFRGSDGREISLREFPIAELLRPGETVRAEEIVLLAPDGRNVTVLLNATPILSDAGIVESVVITLQDMAAVEVHGGRMWAESDGQGWGARFTFTLPTVEETGNATAIGAKSSSSRPLGHGSREVEGPVNVLVVDDEP